MVLESSSDVLFVYVIFPCDGHEVLWLSRGTVWYFILVMEQMVSTTRQSVKDIEFKLIASLRHEADMCCLYLSA